MHNRFASRIACFRSVVLTLAAAAWWPVTAHGQGRDDLWEVTTKMEMPGMPMAMPAQVHRVCVAKNRKDEDLIPKRDNCRLLENARTGNKVTYKMACTGPEASEVAGEMTYVGDAYEGRMRITAKSGGQSMEMTQTFAGKRVGDCTATK